MVVVEGVMAGSWGGGVCRDSPLSRFLAQGAHLHSTPERARVFRSSQPYRVSSAGRSATLYVVLRLHDGTLVLSATDITAHLACPHLSSSGSRSRAASGRAARRDDAHADLVRGGAMRTRRQARAAERRVRRGRRL